MEATLKKDALSPLCGRLKEMGASAAAVIPVSDIVFEPAFRDACKQNSCGKYNRCWMCPPDVGEIDALIAQAKTYSQALVFQTISPLEDSYDIEGMLDAGRRHCELALAFSETLKNLPLTVLRLASGACQTCETCGKPEGIPCRNPEQATASLESYGIYVSQLASACGLKYVNGTNTVTYFGAFLFREPPQEDARLKEPAE